MSIHVVVAMTKWMDTPPSLSQYADSQFLALTLADGPVCFASAPHWLVHPPLDVAASFMSLRSLHAETFRELSFQTYAASANCKLTGSSAVALSLRENEH